MLDPVFFSLLGRFEGGVDAERRGRSLDRFGESAPGARTLVRPTLNLVDMLAQGVGGLAVLLVNAPQLLISRSSFQLRQRLLIRLGRCQLSSQERVEQISCIVSHVNLLRAHGALFVSSTLAKGFRLVSDVLAVGIASSTCYLGQVLCQFYIRGIPPSANWRDGGRGSISRGE